MTTSRDKSFNLPSFLFVYKGEFYERPLIIGMQQIQSKIWIWGPKLWDFGLGLYLYVLVGILFVFAFGLNWEA
jgi:hypothetical protein